MGGELPTCVGKLPVAVANAVNLIQRKIVREIDHCMIRRFEAVLARVTRTVWGAIEFIDVGARSLNSAVLCQSEVNKGRFDHSRA